ncbi:hypothetical protein HUT18_09190 [Streptomyces sp. NA04227]|uniref:hypothetical protein n=1 Tax=Streptomyces sp. NA04227 TaxID=2742136 RepID=UPI00158FEB71|nr:hypothetical protein [Streptomyces sp. NA04227]QKW06552.1 hypothetical protein HUT18_09190 [Streptomyces sp. NA04227]
MRRIRAVTALVVVPLSVPAMQGCNPHQYDSVPSVTDVRSSELTGTWRGLDGTRVVLKADGTAEVARLDGQEFDFDEGWRLSGTGTWRLTDRPSGWGDGQHVSLKVTRRTAAETREPEDGEPRASQDGEPAPKAYTWTLEMERGEKGLRLFFLFGDPDSRSYYVLQRAG